SNNYRNKTFRSISDVLFKERDFKKLVTKAKEEEVVIRFSEIFPELSSIAQAVKFNHNILFLKVENSVWRSELNLKQTAIISKIKKSIKEISIDKIKFIS
ncbi:MAG: DciA family protein, partial [Melioribacteraceae bacterium]|nr:DciA family protein [Melioribacteraceae bacterium]